MNNKKEMAITFLAVTAVMTIGISGIDEDAFLGMAVYGLIMCILSETIKGMPKYYLRNFYWR